MSAVSLAVRQDVISRAADINGVYPVLESGKTTVNSKIVVFFLFIP